MGAIRIRVNTHGVLDYAQTGKKAVREVRQAVEHVLLIGRTEARTTITSQFRVRTGRLQGESARGMKAKIALEGARFFGRIAPLPHLMNIFERGATLPARTLVPRSGGILAMPTAAGVTYFGTSADLPTVKLRPRPVILPASQAMESKGSAIFERLMARVGRA